MMQTLPQATGQVWDASYLSSQATWLKQSKPLGTAIADKGIKVTVKPNPADTWVAFDYVLPEGVRSATLTITDSQGKAVESFEVTGRQGQKLWDTRHIGSGIYFYTLRAAQLSKSGKIVIR